VDSQAKLAEEGIAARVVSMPSWELFERQSSKYRESVLPAASTARLAIEAAVSMGWAKYVGQKGDVISMERFGASAPYQVLMEKFGFNVANVVAKAKALLGK
jgi:transketolase